MQKRFGQVWPYFTNVVSSQFALEGKIRRQGQSFHIAHTRTPLFLLKSPIKHKGQSLEIPTPLHKTLKQKQKKIKCKKLQFQRKSKLAIFYFVHYFD